MSQTEQTGALAVRAERELRASADDIFDALVDPEKQRDWLSPLGPDAGAVQTSVDLRVGGVWEASFQPNPETQVHDVQTYVVIDRPHRLVTDVVSESVIGGQPMPTIASRIAFTFTPTAAGTLVTAEQTGFPSAEMRDFFEASVWPSAFDRIENFLASR
ncbi:SRPBCC domain-containing protein [Microbacterium sp. NEAU-LLC]|uniref:SRPBCC domain-containing protein n=1 Tax=Microbacterium helvum TaxID=2773713 RepID=A0ABR8NQ52_9MICO|nr:SRPBCC domain-containing protein [Microbacterium helvum]MBD3942759.1 SRPBCC domain-containing protein [Microbacterium helvum]